MVSLFSWMCIVDRSFFRPTTRERERERKVRKGLDGNTFSHSGGGGAERCMAIFHSLGVFVVIYSTCEVVRFKICSLEAFFRVKPMKFKGLEIL
jgi:hypothetical protein